MEGILDNNKCYSKRSTAGGIYSCIDLKLSDQFRFNRHRQNRVEHATEALRDINALNNDVIGVIKLYIR